MQLDGCNGAASAPTVGVCERSGSARPDQGVLMSRMLKVLAATAAVVVGLAGCGGSDDNGSASGPTTNPATTASPSVSGNITVFAAASLTESFGELGKQFEAAHPGTKVTFSFAASSALATQINAGAPADVFASASQKNMDQVVTAGGASDPKVFAKNVMEIATPPSNPANIASVN